jgi:quercetin dioxygenase-like cupin family protein
MARRVSLFRWEDLPLEKVTDMVARKTVASAESTLSQTYFKKGTIVPLHVCARDLVICVLQGAIRARVDGDDLTVREGDVLAVAGGAPHQAEMLDDTFVMTFAPK